ncbi:MAG: glycosyltransferase family 4 protein [Cyanobacteria bacterium J06642_2]
MGSTSGEDKTVQAAMGQTAAVYYRSEGYSTQGKRLLGRQSAGESFLKSLMKFGSADALYCYTDTRAEFDDFQQFAQDWLPQPKPQHWLPTNRPAMLANAGTLYKPDTILAPLAWQRRFGNQRAYSLCGVTHTIASKGVMQAIGDLAIAPLQPWDALICTSNTVKIAVERILGTWIEYLGQRLGTTVVPALPQLPVIPLGVECDRFVHGDSAREPRQRLRQKLGIADEDIVVLFVGRLIFYGKAHPTPMYLALERAARQASDRKIHLIQAGWFDDEREPEEFKRGAQLLCPSVNAIFLDGRQPDVRADVWAASDIFISLSDNIQETFGLTPIEAMASGLPVVVSAWDGYRESVRHEVDGFQIPTLMPPPGAGLDLAADFQADTLNYSTYMGHVAMASSVDVEACASALLQLIEDSELRQHLGENGRQRAETIYDWKHVIGAYERLWVELATLRTEAAMSAPCRSPQPASPLCDDPFRVFGHYPTATLAPETCLGLGSMAAAEPLAQVRSLWMNQFGTNRRVQDVVLDGVLAEIAACKVVTVADLVAQQRIAPRERVSPARLLRALGYAIKFDILRPIAPTD